MSRMGQHIQQMQEGQPEKMEPDPLYDERDWQKQQQVDPGYLEFLLKELTNTRKEKW